jgi:hypothetical protein
MPETRSDRLGDKAAELDAPGIVLIQTMAPTAAAGLLILQAVAFFCFCPPLPRHTNSKCAARKPHLLPIINNAPAPSHHHSPLLSSFVFIRLFLWLIYRSFCCPKGLHRHRLMLRYSPIGKGVVMFKRATIGAAVLILCACAQQKTPEQMGYADLPDPPINLVHVVRPGEPVPPPTSGVADISLSASQPIYSIWNDPDTHVDPWGSILLERVENDGTVALRLNGVLMSAKVGQPFPSTGIVVARSDPAMQNALLRAKWTMTTKSEAR